MLNDNEYIAIMSDNLAMLRAKAALTQAEIAKLLNWDTSNNLFSY